MIAAVNVTAADTTEDAEEQDRQVRRKRVAAMAGRRLAPGRTLSEEEIDMLIDSPAGQQILDMLRYTAVGTRDQVREYLEAFRDHAQADELMIALQAPSGEQATHSMGILADAWGLDGSV